VDQNEANDDNHAREIEDACGLESNKQCDQAGELNRFPDDRTGQCLIDARYATM
jgi:hypothetical protein